MAPQTWTRPIAWVVYESMFGNTQRVARAIADGLANTYDVALYEVGDAPDVVPSHVALLVVGGPTHAFSTSTPDTRRTAAAQGKPVVSTGRGVREWLAQLALDGAPLSAAFDTRLHRPLWFWGSAARRVHRELARLGARSATAPECFFVRFPSRSVDVTQSLVDGDLTRAEVWGRELGRSAPTTRVIAAAA